VFLNQYIICRSDFLKTDFRFRIVTYTYSLVILICFSQIFFFVLLRFLCSTTRGWAMPSVLLLSFWFWDMFLLSLRAGVKFVTLLPLLPSHWDCAWTTMCCYKMVHLISKIGPNILSNISSNISCLLRYLTNDLIWEKIQNWKIHVQYTVILTFLG
jgi:hypothetical protein